MYINTFFLHTFNYPDFRLSEYPTITICPANRVVQYIVQAVKKNGISPLRKIFSIISGYYGTTAVPYQAFGVGDGTWSTNGTDPMTFLGGYNPHDSYGMDGS